MPTPSGTQRTTWAAAVNKMGPWCPTNLRAACYTLATSIGATAAPSDELMTAWANQIWNFASTFSNQQWEQANTTAVAMIVQAGGDTMAIDFTTIMVASGMAPNQARAIANYFVAQFRTIAGGGDAGIAVAMAVALG